MAKKAEKSRKTPFMFGVKQGEKTEILEFVRPAFKYNGQVYSTADLFDGENLKEEHAQMAADLFKIGSGVIKKVLTP